MWLVKVGYLVLPDLLAPNYCMELFKEHILVDGHCQAFMKTTLPHQQEV